MRRFVASLLACSALAAHARAQDGEETELLEEAASSEPDDPLDAGTERELDQLILRLLPEVPAPAGGEDATLETLEGDWAPEEPPGDEDDDEERPLIPFWGEERGYIGGMVDLGFLYLEPRFHFAYGIPHEMWAGAELNPIISGSGIGVYGGLRGALPWGDLRVGARYRFNWTRSFLEALDGYDNLQFRDRIGPNANYLSLESQLSIDVPVDTTAFVGEATVTYVIPFEQGSYVALYEDTLRVITVTPGLIWSLALAWRFRFGPDNALSVEPGAELVHLVGREEIVLRIGLTAGIRLWPDLDVRLIAMPAILSPDSIGASGGHTFLLGIRYRWATDTPRFGAP